MRERVKKVMAQVFEIHAESIPDDLKMDDIEQWSSLGQINLVLGIEEEFGLKIPTEKILELSSLDKIVRYLDKAASQ